MNNTDRLNEINENIVIFLALVAKFRGRKQIRERFVNFTMEYSLKNHDCEIYLDQFDGSRSSITKVKNNGLGVSNSVKPKINKRQANEINEGSKYFMGRIREAQKDRNIEAIMLQHNIMRGVTTIFIAHIPD
jgi:aspartate-semialdehyde dehydrogenase